MKITVLLMISLSTANFYCKNNVGNKKNRKLWNFVFKIKKKIDNTYHDLYDQRAKNSVSEGSFQTEIPLQDYSDFRNSKVKDHRSSQTRKCMKPLSLHFP